MNGIHYHYGFINGDAPDANALQAVTFKLGHPYLVIYSYIDDNERYVMLDPVSFENNISSDKLPFLINEEVVYKSENDFPREWGRTDFESAIADLRADLID